MRTRIFLITAAAVALVTGAGLAFADNADQGRDDQSTANQNNRDRGDQDRQDATQGTNPQDYSEHWFSPTGYGPNDDQADATRALNNKQLEERGRGGHDEGQQGPSDRGHNDHGDQAPPPSDSN